ncbi:universal stress protein [Parasporobacterium paucivorans]|uniref:Nucleotide-binding universal stress protein, UspA family n=1 Tax=Parasporobacterium paucivorans DSM 15970 TaxID=1122934 RepID=A0A1M6E3D3_9FIRM|nr:universal stress protein [Parasporobacterium paucivorans]SHI79961.1 Nucleotide-binding universal stress protein, UspA family [Parasporobacterium paucivorans DSM 15970]
MKILVPVDGSLASKNAVAEAIKIAKKDNGSIKLITVVDFHALAAATGEVYVAIVKQMGEDADILLNSIINETDFGGLYVEREVLTGRAYEEILRAAEDEKFDMIVMGNRGFSRIKRFFVGSVTQRVISEATCPVLVVHTEAEE